MASPTTAAPTGTLIASRLTAVRGLMASTLEATPLRRIVEDTGTLLGSGKMLRSRLIFRVGEAAQVPEEVLTHAAAAVEMIHGASLLHDDVIDGGYLRRNQSTFWVDRGVPGAILLGDLMLFRALEILGRVESGALVRDLILLTGDVCEAEAEQELVLRGLPPTWENCVRIARRKTGALFAFAGLAAAGPDPGPREALRESGFLAGTAYQLSDDLLDASGNLRVAGKTLGTDEQRLKTTAATAAPTSPVPADHAIVSMCRDAESILKPWPAIQDAWREWACADLYPSIEKNAGIPLF